MNRLALILVLAFALGACGTIWTVGFFGATLSVEFPREPVATMTANVRATTVPATRFDVEKP